MRERRKEWERRQGENKKEGRRRKQITESENKGGKETEKSGREERE